MTSATSNAIPAAKAPLIDTRISAFLVFAVGFLIAIASGLAADNADYARAKYTVWPMMALGGWTVALMLRYGFCARLDETAWRTWWAWGFLAYVVHLYWGFGIVFGWSFAAVYAGQGSLVAGANFTLLVLWGASVLASFARWPARWLHILTALFFAVSAMVASIVFGRDISPIGGAIILGIWLVALYLRQPEPKR